MLKRLFDWLRKPATMDIKCHVCRTRITGPADEIHLVAYEHLESPEHRLAWKEREEQ